MGGDKKACEKFKKSVSNDKNTNVVCTGPINNIQNNNTYFDEE